MPIILVTGASGFIGSHLCAALVARGYQVRAMVRPTSNPRWLEGLPVELTAADLGQPETLIPAVRGIDYIVHAAARLKARHQTEFVQANLRGTRALAQAAADHASLKKLVFISSIAAAGPSGASSGPVSWYGQSKLQAEQTVAEFSDRFPVAVVRFPAIYGPRDRDGLTLFKLFQAGWSPVTDMVFSLCYVTDAVEALISLVETPGNWPEPCSASDGQTYRYEDLATIAEQILGHRIRRVRVPAWLLSQLAWWNERLSREVPILNQDKARELKCPAWTCGSEELRARTGYVPKTDIYTGVRLTLEWYQQNGWC